MREATTRLWAILAAGFCLAAREMRLYTAVYHYQGLTIDGLVLGGALAALLFALAVPFLRRARRALSLVLAFAVLTVLQEVAVMAEGFAAAGLISEGAHRAATVLIECYAVGLVIVAVAAARVFGERSAAVFIGGFALSGLLQLVTALLKWEVALVLIDLFPLAALLCFVLFMRQAAGAEGCGLAAEASGSAGGVGGADGATDVSGAGSTGGVEGFPVASAGASTTGDLSDWRLTRGDMAALLLGFFLMGALLVSTHATRMGYQDGGSYSMAIQVLSGLGGLAAAAILRVLDRRLSGKMRLALVYLLVLPVLLVALYATSLFENIAVLVLLVFFHRFVYGLVYYFTWLLCFAPCGGARLSDRFVTAFFVLKTGWAAGVLFFMILPANLPDVPWSVVLIGFFFALGLVDAFLLVGMLRTAEKAAEADGVARGGGAEALVAGREGADGSLDERMAGYEEACRRVTEAYGLTRRESEVLSYLGKGRTAAFIREKMFISDGTVRTHIDHIYKKLGIHSQQALIDIVDAAERA